MDHDALLTHPAPRDVPAWSPFAGVEARLRGALAVASAPPSAWQPAVLRRLLDTVTAMLLEHHATVEPPAFPTVWHWHARPEALTAVLMVACEEAAVLGALVHAHPSTLQEPLADPQFRRCYYRLLNTVAYAGAVVRCLPMSQAG